MIKLNINKKNYEVDVDPDMPLLWVLRDVIGLMGTKYGCGVAQCGACVVHLNGFNFRAAFSLLTEWHFESAGKFRNDRYFLPWPY